MTRRAWWLVALNVFVPGSAQMLAGSRKLGRFAVVVTALLWVLAILAFVLFFWFRELFLAAVTNVFVLAVIEVVLIAYVILWIVLAVDSLRLAQVKRASVGARPFVVAFSLIALVAYSGVAVAAVNIVDSARSTITEVFTSADYAPPTDGRYNILLLGGDAGPDRVGLRPDSISIASVDAETGETTLIGIPRNLEFIPFVEGSPLYQDFPSGYDCGDECLISYLYTYGEEHPELYPDAEANDSSAGVEAMRDAVEGVTGLDLQYYVLIDMQGFDDLIDALGGVLINVTERQPIGGDEDQYGQPINVDGWVEVGERVLGGYEALWYARARHGSNDYDRMLRQREVQEAILRQFEPANILTKFRTVADAGKQVVTTDIPSVMLSLFTELASGAQDFPIATLELSPPTIDVGNPDYELIRELVAESVVGTPDAESESE
ncbi:MULTISPECIES: LCP family protein [unclassified Salinibacterium]|uniref:LCP family protein n=1 Tax=unclassified Salinibacterium TaxID=2632331 RepID=UPI0018CE1DA3|nr:MULTISPECIES: LCP family protein [unclassified Salinibacterium]MBH0053553.1 LCP family protein [Salinibacterium sp. SWN139]MBH0082821.1 LCP family protein [Salinibacterium sp. SWN167]